MGRTPVELPARSRTAGRRQARIVTARKRRAHSGSQKLGLQFGNRADQNQPKRSLPPRHRRWKVVELQHRKNAGSARCRGATLSMSPAGMRRG